MTLTSGKQMISGASAHLLLHLRSLASAIANPTRTQWTRGRIVKRKIPGGYRHSFLWKDGPNFVGLSQIDVKALRELGQILTRVAEGKNARLLFGQNRRTKPKKTDEHEITALAYWSVRALNPPAKDRRALRKARSMYPELNLSDATIRKCAQKYRNAALGLLTLGKRIKNTRIGGRVLHMRTPEQIAGLREYLRKKSARVDE